MMTCGVMTLSQRYIKKVYTVALPLKINQLCLSTCNSALFNRVKLKMNEAFLRHEKGSETFNFFFRFINPKYNVDRQFNLSRRTTESVETFLKRIDVNIHKYVNKKKQRRAKKKPNTVEEDELVDNVDSGDIMLLKENTKVDLNDSCNNLLTNPSNLSIVIMGTPYVIKYNAPWIIGMKLPTSILVGFPVYPSEFEAFYTDKTKSHFTWYKLNSEAKLKTWQQIGEGFIYTPTTADIRSTLKLKCLPRNDTSEGPEIEVESTDYVQAGPGICPFESRHAFTSTKLSGNNFRIVSYNILANTYADSDYSRNVLFPYCPPYALEIDYRKLLIIKELIGYNSDIICLQEVDKKVYENDLKCSLSSLNYDGIFSSKGQTSEGVAILYNTKRFQIIDSKSLVMSENIDFNPIFKNVWDKVTNEKVRERFTGRKTSLLIVVVKSIDNPSQILVIGNTHLYFRPDADHIRLLQSFYVLSACQNVAEQFLKENPQCNTTVMICGDFNSTPKDGVYELITKNFIPEDHGDWKPDTEEAVTNIFLSHEFQLASACGTPEYTNFTVGFADCLDYIFYEKNKLQVNQVIPMPSREELSLHGAIPSVVFPSDHIAICADMNWNL